MTHVLFIGDEPINHQLVKNALQPLDCQISLRFARRFCLFCKQGKPQKTKPEKSTEA